MVVEPLIYSSFSLSAISNVFTRHVATYGLQLVWSTINSLQLIVHLPLNNVIVPAKSQMVFNELQLVASFDYLEAVYP